MNTLELFEHNKITYEKVKDLWNDSRDVAVVQATGTGKSYLIANILQDFAAKRKVVIAPSKYILRQLQEQFGFNDTETIYFTYSKAMRLTAHEIAELKPKLIVLDEFHRAGAEAWGKGVMKIIKKYPRAYKLGTTATPVRYLDDARDMSQELFSGNVAAQVNLAQAIARGILPMPKYISALYTLENEIESHAARISKNRSINSEKKQELSSRLDNIKLDFQKSQGIPVILKKHLNAEYKKLVVFCKNYRHLLEMEPTVKSWFIQTGIFENVNTYRVVTAEPEREKSFSAFTQHRDGKVMDLLLCVDMFNEGLHIKGVDGVMLLRETVSPNIFYQQIGRALKVGNDNHPVIFDFVNNFKSVHARTFLKDVEFSFHNSKRSESQEKEHLRPNFSIYDETLEVHQLFLNLKTHDHPWNAKISLLKQFKDAHGYWEMPTGELKNLVSKFRTLYKKGMLDSKWVDALNQIGFEWSNPKSNAIILQTRIEQLKKYKQENGHLAIPSTDPELGKIAVELRSNYHEGRLFSKWIDALNEIGFEWNHAQKKLENSFNSKLDLIKAFFQEHGHLEISRRYPEIGKNLDQLRRLYRKGMLDEKWLNALNEIDTDWFENKGGYIVNYTKRVQQLKAFRKQHGHLNIPNTDMELGSFVKGLRSKYKKGTLKQTYIDMLNSIGFAWELPDSLFFERIEQLKEFRREQGHLNVSIYHPQLGGFAKGVRKRFRNGTLNKKWLDALNKLDFAWDTEKYHKKIKLEERIEQLKSFKQRYGHLNIPFHEPGIGIFAARKRLQYKRGKLDQHWIDVLNHLGFEWKYRKKRTVDQFQRRISQLKKFKEEHGHLKIPVKHGELGTFASILRMKYRKGQLSRTWVKALEDLGFPWEHIYSRKPKDR